MTTLAADLYLLLAALGLALSVGYAGLPMLGQGAFVAVGAFGTALLDRAGLPLGVAVLAAVAVGGVTGYVVAYGAARLEGALLALATWALAWLGYAVLVGFPGVSGGSQGLVRPAPTRLVSPSLGVELTLTPLVHIVAAGVLCVLVMAALARVERGPGGLDLAALREGPLVADALGVPVARRRRVVLATTAALGALAGAGTGVLQGVVAPADYSPLLSLELLVAVLLVGGARWWGPVVGVAALAALPPVADALARTSGADPGRSRGVLTAALLVAVLALRGPLRRRIGRRRRNPAELPGCSAGLGAVRPPVMAARGVVASYGALRALDGVDLDIRGGEVHALVGPNGSGKSTLLRVLAGALPADSGAITLDGAPVPRAGSQAARVRAGVVRTYQRTALLPGLSPLRQAQIGARRPSPYAVLRHLLATPSSRGETSAREAAGAVALASCGLAARADAVAVQLPAGEQRLLQVARAVATGARVLLLDEPAAGMSGAERAELVTVVHRIAGSGRAVLVVEHDMALVGRIADRVTVLAAGRAIASGPPAAVRADPVVRRAYLGNDRQEVPR